MTPEQFVYWLQGYAEISMDSAPNQKEWTTIKDHLATVFKKVTPDRQVYPLGPAMPNNPTKPDPLKYPYNPNPLGPYVTSPSWVRPEIFCSTTTVKDLK